MSRMLFRRVSLMLLLSWSLAGTAGCSRERPAAHAKLCVFDAGVGGEDDGESEVPDPGPEVAKCASVQSAEPVPARDVVSVLNLKPGQRAVLTSNLFGLFKGACGACHVETIRGDFQVKDVGEFAEATSSRQALILERIRSEDPNKYMPPPGQSNAKPWSERAETDPLVELAQLLELWFKAGSPGDLLYVGDDSTTGPANTYVLRKSVAQSLTNIGSCLPNRAMLATDESSMDAKDAFFASATALPSRLDQTDLVSYDSEVLAHQGVLSYAPAYPLFSDNARKMRHLRLPRGESLAFDAKTQEFDVPDNTRVYKTFMKEVIDANGNARYKKIETRLIVVRADGPDEPDGSHETRSLFGTYAWNEEETEAILVTGALRDGKPFRDVMLSYVSNEVKAAEVVAKEPSNRVAALFRAGAMRNYAIPGRERCIQCHMGSHNRSFLLGLTPLQMRRRATGEGGTYEDTSEDELEQLERLIEYGTITGLSSPDEVKTLEQSQGARPPRNDHELKAQGYMLGNCAHCHNPRGFPTTQNPELKDLLDFFPNEQSGGVFQFPLERTSPRIKRGEKQESQIPYIVPWLFDEEQPNSSIYAQKWMGYPGSNGAFNGYYMVAPWRSLIYRNVESPFTYAEDYALFPHMPMNSVGFDCRVPEIFGNWMISIPARMNDAEGCTGICFKMDWSTGGLAEGQTLYSEVKPGDPGYQDALAGADQRLTAYHVGGAVGIDKTAPGDRQTFAVQNPELSLLFLSPDRATKYCPDTSDILDPNVGGTQLTPGDHSSLPSMSKQAELDSDQSVDGLFASLKNDGVPDHAHWVLTDITETPGEWYPRRTDWASVLVDGEVGSDPQQKKVVSMLKQARLTNGFRAFATTPVPFGLWQPKDDCTYQDIPRVSSLTPETRPWWFDKKTPTPRPTDPLYYQSPGAMVFNEICVNCHGAKYDSRGRQADTLMSLTGGEARVANFKEGILGPSSAPGENRKRVFGLSKYLTEGLTYDDWTARYVAWMGLGGTQRQIPNAILDVVGAVSVLGVSRDYPAKAGSANMLAIAQSLCGQSLGYNLNSAPIFNVQSGRTDYTGSALIGTNADAEVWQKLCAWGTRPPVRAIYYDNGDFKIKSAPSNLDARSSWYRPETYPAYALVGDERGIVSANSVTGVATGNLGPWCVMWPTDPKNVPRVEEVQAARSPDNPLPICPSTWLTEENRIKQDDFETWTLRGAMNAGFAVFLYLDGLSRDALVGKQPQPAYDKCENLE
ncbi:MAG: hypothetical protein QM778_28980 [Myxococcales bacterium]